MEFRGPRIAEYKIDRYIKIINSIDVYINRKVYYRENIIKILNSFDLPLPSETYLKHSSKILLKLTMDAIYSRLVNTQYITNDMSKKISDASARLDISFSASDYSYRLRAFSAGGIYPNESFIRHDASYMVVNNRPHMLTRNHNDAEVRARGGGDENSVLTRREVKLISSFMCVNGLIVKFSLIDDFDFSNVFDVNEGYLVNIPQSEIVEVIFEYAAIRRKSKFTDVASFEFTAVGDSMPDIAVFYRKFKIDDLLLLRTCYLLIKASSMAMTPNYFEDAVSNIFISLEGVMTLLQRNAGKPYEHIDRDLQKGIYEDIFQESSEGIYSFVIEEVFARGEKRAALMHPQAAATWGWVPFLMGGDYPEYRQILRCMIFFTVTGIRYDPYKYW